MNVEELQGLELKRSLDQHFLVDDVVLDREIRLAELEKDDVVLEIGAGIGNLTAKIAARCKVIAVEKDAQFMPMLQDIKDATVLHADALSVLNGLTFNKVVSNIPYSISQPLLLQLLKKKWDMAVLIVQKEFAQKMLSGSKLAILVNDCCDFDIDSFVPGGAFYPPAPESALIVMRQKKIMDEKFWKFLTSVYRERNKNVKNVVEKYPEELAKKKVHQLGIKELKAIYEMNSK